MKKQFGIFVLAAVLMTGTVKAETPEGWLTSLKEWVSGAENTVTIKPSDKYLTERKKTGNIVTVEAHSGLDVVYTQQSGDAFVEVYAPDNLMPYIVVQKNGDLLRVSLKPGCRITGKHNTQIRVFAPEVTSFSASSSADIYLAKGLSTKKGVSLKASSSGDVVANENLTCGSLSLKASSSGDVKLKGIACAGAEVGASSSGDIEITSITCSDFSAAASSSGDIEVGNMVCAGNVSCAASSSGDVVVGEANCKGKVSADVSSAGGVKFEKGNAKDASYQASSGAQINAEGLHALNVVARASSGGSVSCYASETISMHRSSGGSIHCEGRPRLID